VQSFIGDSVNNPEESEVYGKFGLELVGRSWPAILFRLGPHIISLAQRADLSLPSANWQTPLFSTLAGNV
jgi:hypothetical protein